MEDGKGNTSRDLFLLGCGDLYEYERSVQPHLVEDDSDDDDAEACRGMQPVVTLVAHEKEVGRTLPSEALPQNCEHCDVEVQVNLSKGSVRFAEAGKLTQERLIPPREPPEVVGKSLQGQVENTQVSPPQCKCEGL